jgi:hypothetical protein
MSLVAMVAAQRAELVTAQRLAHSRLVGLPPSALSYQGERHVRVSPRSPPVGLTGPTGAIVRTRSHAVPH